MLTTGHTHMLWITEVNNGSYKLWTPDVNNRSCMLWTIEVNNGSYKLWTPDVNNRSCMLWTTMDHTSCGLQMLTTGHACCGPLEVNNGSYKLWTPDVNNRSHAHTCIQVWSCYQQRWINNGSYKLWTPDVTNRSHTHAADHGCQQPTAQTDLSCSTQAQGVLQQTPDPRQKVQSGRRAWSRPLPPRCWCPAEGPGLSPLPSSSQTRARKTQRSDSHPLMCLQIQRAL